MMFSCAVLLLVTPANEVLKLLDSTVAISQENSIGQNAKSYTSANALKKVERWNQSVNWYVKVRASAHYYLFFIILALDILGVFNLKETNFSSAMFPYLVLFYVVALVTFNLGSIGRFKGIFMFLVLVRYINLYSDNYRHWMYRILGMVLTPIVSLFLIVLMRAELYYAESYLPIHNVISIFLIRSSESMSEFIVGH